MVFIDMVRDGSIGQLVPKSALRIAKGVLKEDTSREIAAQEWKDVVR